MTEAETGRGSGRKEWGGGGGEGSGVHCKTIESVIRIQKNLKS